MTARVEEFVGNGKAHPLIAIKRERTERLTTRGRKARRKGKMAMKGKCPARNLPLSGDSAAEG